MRFLKFLFGRPELGMARFGLGLLAGNLIYLGCLALGIIEIKHFPWFGVIMSLYGAMLFTPSIILYQQSKKWMSNENQASPQRDSTKR